MPAWTLTEDDIKQHPQFGKIPVGKILFAYGMDTRKYWEIDPRSIRPDDEILSEGRENQFGYSHRSTLTGKVCTGKRYVGSAREDGSMGAFIDRFLDLPLDESRRNRPRFSSKR